jgi:hypothetical protein
VSRSISSNSVRQPDGSGHGPENISCEIVAPFDLSIYVDPESDRTEPISGAEQVERAKTLLVGIVKDIQPF